MRPPRAAVLIILISMGALAGLYLYRAFTITPTGPTCSNGATDYPACSNNTCSNGATNYPVCSNNTSSCRDLANISSHVYVPVRLQVVRSCITVSGTVNATIYEADGDVHVRLRLDPASSNWTNSANDQYQYGYLVVEVVCVRTPTQTDAIPACQGYTNQILVPRAGEHITVTGPYVLDRAHHNWAEVHPVYSLVIG